MMPRLAKIVMCLALGIYAALAAADNIIDPAPNYTFLRHVLGMDTALQDSLLRSRAITSPAFLQLAYGGIITGEMLTGLLYMVAAGALWRERRAAAARFDHAKRWLYAAGTLGFLVWFGGFEVGGGEWFAMWQSPHWNGQQAAFRFYMTILGVLIFVSLPERELAPDADPRS